MYILLGIIAVFVVIFLIEWLCEKVPQFVRNRAARQVLEEIDLDKTRNEIMVINDTSGSIRPGLKCPSCGGKLEAWDSFNIHHVRCSRFPACTYIRRVV